MSNLFFMLLILYSECSIYEMIATFEEEPMDECCINWDFEFPFDSCTQIDGEDSTFKITWSSDLDFTNAQNMFEGCSELTYLDASNFDTSHITDMSGMFKDCTNLKSINLNNFNTELVTTMESMFSGCESLESLDLSNFNNYQLTKC